MDLLTRCLEGLTNLHSGTSMPKSGEVHVIRWASNKMPRHDWYRNKTWNPGVEREFFAKLERARSQRDQYLVIQALTLATHDPEASLRLVEYFFETRTSEFEVLRALLARAEAYVTLGKLPQAVETYKAVLTRETEYPDHQSNAYIDLPYLVARRAVRDEYQFALDLLEKHKKKLMFPIDHFRWHASRALIFDDLGRLAEARDHARSAVKVANIRKSGFRYHQDLGLVGDAERDVVKAMHRLGA